ncbi:uncharacterized protein EDB91DRAFT_685253 [Suillus paluster]|uniref:uncharacterized protein n=1 Tax=Suillus paluster TaxID=48578 RepID=UPI001B86C6B6|nr:uncharacterized protein EDB91DRAFT_685253 [Suillus paluster]KAG1750362.1 hypothetical protein EDB91DRAFT_685253 [Suillus paluster]
MLQYIIDLGYFQMIPVGTSEQDVPPVTRRKRLRQYDAAWQRFQYRQRCRLPSMMLGHTHELLGGVYISVRDSRIYFARLPSASDCNDLHCWSHPIDVVTSVEFTFCAAQDLFVVAAFSADIRSHVYDIHLKSLTTNDTHPDAVQPILKGLGEYH